ncbi:glutathione S-transferase [Aspergillus karnatakaensis]|uniref:maleylacetoacetate isomerase MaiA n=1 Tax=Aspergillus karnatakaensis TaxID=1810916 RepID=UPI003CCDC98A
MTTQPRVTITLHTYFRSSCSARLRIALALKSLPYTSIPVNLLKNEQADPKNTFVNPSATVPTLIINYPETSEEKTVTITQSLAALEYLEEAFPDTPRLLPPLSNPESRALVRTLVDIVSCDIQPVTNLRILKRVAPFGVDRSAWSKELIEDGLRAYESIVRQFAGKFSVGDEITMADVCLIPAVWGAERVGIDFGNFPTVKRIAEGLEVVEAVREGHWTTQGDTPEEFRK